MEIILRTLIKNGHIIDPARHMSYKADILVENGIISGIIQVKAGICRGYAERGDGT